MQSKSFVVVGGGIVGSSIALELAKTGRRVTLIEKEGGLATHQTGRNSGVIHAGPYYKPGSLKAQLCTEGNRSMVKFAEEHEIPFEVTGKLLLGTKSYLETHYFSSKNLLETNNLPRILALQRF